MWLALCEKIETQKDNMKLLPYWRSFCLDSLPGTPIHHVYKPNKPPKPKALAGTGGFNITKADKKGAK